MGAFKIYMVLYFYK